MNLEIKRRFFECVTVFGKIINLCILWIDLIRISAEIILVNKIFILILTTKLNFLALFADRILLLYDRLIAYSRTVIGD